MSKAVTILTITTIDMDAIRFGRELAKNRNYAVWVLKSTEAAAADEFRYVEHCPTPGVGGHLNNRSFGKSYEKIAICTAKGQVELFTDIA